MYAVLGGTGYGLFNELPDIVEYTQPDYTIYPGFPHALGFITRGCMVWQWNPLPGKHDYGDCCAMCDALAGWHGIGAAADAMPQRKVYTQESYLKGTNAGCQPSIG